MEEVEDDLRQEEGKRVFKIDDEDGEDLNSPTDLIAKAELEPLSLEQKKLSQELKQAATTEESDENDKKANQ